MSNYIRVFFAIDIPPSIKATLGDIINQLQKTLDNDNIQWIKPENLHITLQFIRNIDSGAISTLLSRVDKAIREIHSFSLMLGPSEFFPSLSAPRFISFKVTSMNDALITLVETIGYEMQAMDIMLEKRVFRPHITFGKLRLTSTLPLVSNMNNQCLSLMVDKVTLFRSELHGNSSYYTILDTIPLSKVF